MAVRYHTDRSGRHVILRSGLNPHRCEWMDCSEEAYVAVLFQLEPTLQILHFCPEHMDSYDALKENADANRHP